MAATLHRIFVYGTLKTGHPNHYLLRGSRGMARLLGGAKLAEKYPLVVTTPYGITALLNVPGSGKEIFGELYEVDDSMLSVLDDLEDHPVLYTRTPTLCHLLPESTSTPSPITTPRSQPSQAPSAQPSRDDTKETPVKCEAYIIFNFNKALLSLPYLSCYNIDTQGQTKYSSKENRENVKATVYSLIKE